MATAGGGGGGGGEVEVIKALHDIAGYVTTSTTTWFKGRRRLGSATARQRPTDLVIGM